MTNTRRVSALVSTALLMGALAACDGEAAAPPRTDPPSSSPPSTSSSATGEPQPSDADVAEEAVGMTVRQYFAVVDRLRQDPTTSLRQLRSVAIGGQLTAQEVFTRSQRKAGNQQVGDTRVVEVVVQQLDLGGSTLEGEGRSTAQLDVCWDVAAVDVLDSQGQSIVTPQRPERGWTRYTLTSSRDEAHSKAGWRVSNGVDLEKSPCSAA